MNKNFILFENYFGELLNDGDGTTILGFDTKSPYARPTFSFPSNRSIYGFVRSGFIKLTNESKTIHVNEGWAFSANNISQITFSVHSLVVVWQCEKSIPCDNLILVENEGRLKYIDGAKDSILINPIKFGDPCLNALYMPSGINQTEHTHPSTRSGFIIRGGARCVTPDETFDLKDNQIFYLKKDALHKFRTDHDENIEMKLIAFHPDSDFGATDEMHPMLNRTIVEGVSANQIKEIQTK